MSEGTSRNDHATYRLSYQWPRQTVILHVDRELTAQSARDLASSLTWFADSVERANDQPHP